MVFSVREELNEKRLGDDYMQKLEKRNLVWGGDSECIFRNLQQMQLVLTLRIDSKINKSIDEKEKELFFDSN